MLAQTLVPFSHGGASDVKDGSHSHLLTQMRHFPSHSSPDQPAPVDPHLCPGPGSLLLGSGSSPFESEEDPERAGLVGGETAGGQNVSSIWGVSVG